jgi:quercetin dioxygenase-like cupin family protein
MQTTNDEVIRTALQATEKYPHYNWENIPSRELRHGVIQRVFRGDQLAIGYNLLHPGMTTSPHQHEFEQIFLLLEGKIRLHVGDEVVDCTAGTVVRIPPNTEHWVEAPKPEDGIAVNMDLFAPIRPDYFELTSYQTDRFTDPR